MKKFFGFKMVAVAMMLVMCFGLIACGKPEGNNETNAAKTGYVFESNGTAVAIDAKAADVVAKLGEPGSYYEVESCAFEGLDKFWYYDSFTIQGYQKNKEDLIYSVSFVDDTVKTKEGIRIGDTVAKVKEAYGADGKQTDSELKYESGNMELVFGVKGDAVTGITYILKQ